MIVTENMTKRDGLVAIAAIVLCLMVANSVFNYVTYTGLHKQVIKTNSLAVENTSNAKALAAINKEHRSENFARLAAIETTQTNAALAQCSQGNHHRASTNGDAAATYDLDTLLVSAITHPSTKQTVKQAAVGRSYLARLEKDLVGLQRLPPIDCAQAVAHPLTYVAPPPQSFASASTPK